MVQRPRRLPKAPAFIDTAWKRACYVGLSSLPPSRHNSTTRSDGDWSSIGRGAPEGIGPCLKSTQTVAYNACSFTVDSKRPCGIPRKRWQDTNLTRTLHVNWRSLTEDQTLHLRENEKSRKKVR